MRFFDEIATGSFYRRGCKVYQKMGSQEYRRYPDGVLIRSRLPVEEIMVEKISVKDVQVGDYLIHESNIKTVTAVIGSIMDDLEPRYVLKLNNKPVTYWPNAIVEKVIL